MQPLVSLSCVVLLLLASSSVWGQHNGNPGFSVYRVDAANSDIRLLIHRAGIFSRLGHSHVISVGKLKGMIYVYPDPGRSRFELEIPLQGLIVDDPRLRREEGDEFASQPSQADIAGTRSNMLGERVLNANQYPIVTLTGTGLSGDGPEFTLALTMMLMGRAVDLRVPLALRLDGDGLEATGAFPLSHSNLGMRPFSTLLGAIRVADAMDFKYRIRAQRVTVTD